MRDSREMNVNQKKLLILLAVIVLGLLARFIPHPSNFAPIGAIALIAGRELNNRFWSMGLAICMMVVSDLFLGFASSTPFVYLGFLLVSVFSMRLFQGPASPAKYALAPLGSSLIFFIISNFGVWAFDGLYPHSFSGILECYSMALPFFHWSLLGDAFFWVMLTSLVALGERRFVRASSISSNV